MFVLYNCAVLYVAMSVLPLIEWNFQDLSAIVNDDNITKLQYGTLNSSDFDITLYGTTSINNGVLNCTDGNPSTSDGNHVVSNRNIPFNITTKSFEVWVRLHNLTWPGYSGPMAIDCGFDNNETTGWTKDNLYYDSIVYDFVDVKQWGTESDGAGRRASLNGAVEVEDTLYDFVHIVFTWDSNGEIAGYRNGTLY